MFYIWIVCKCYLYNLLRDSFRNQSSVLAHLFIVRTDDLTRGMSLMEMKLMNSKLALFKKKTKCFFSECYNTTLTIHLTVYQHTHNRSCQGASLFLTLLISLTNHEKDKNKQSRQIKKRFETVEI